MTAKPRDGRFVWVTWLSKLMAGEVSCEWASWFRTNYQDWDRPPSDFDLAGWTLAHTRLLHELRGRLTGRFETLLVERQAQFRYEVPSGLVLSGIPDLVGLSADGGTVYEVKTGRPRTSDGVQARIYMYCLPRAHPACAGRRLSGRVVYLDGHETQIPPEEAEGEFVDHLEYWLKILDSNDPPERLPSEAKCGYCNIGHLDCPDRIAPALLDERRE